MSKSERLFLDILKFFHQNLVAAILAAIAMGAMLFVKPGQQTKSESLFNWRNKGELEEPRANI
ncbi:hypothetical protein [Bacillus mycoides]|uniref:hypothetical protein n=1 Tax=Bacillus mycoides TaxID=1405 RepID=UPI0003E1C177|nr:hypothetical protein [Bacillus mycoides]ETT84278.1 Major facilitator family transporter [Bacillus mycoides FSL H7-687]QWH54134.1 hypothetical protein EXW44_29200 [Bacillus mycoides]QWI14358.1 hypothetical protein EXW47_29135 [Bacillus mycoides]QWI57970.1 hypothetical protein EXW42_28355 [Bacillus mycoides]